MELVDLRSALGKAQPAFRAKQIYDAVYRLRLTDLGAISSLPKAFREELGRDLPLGLPEIEKYYDSRDGTRRYLLKLDDGKSVETDLYFERGDRHYRLTLTVVEPAA